MTQISTEQLITEWQALLDNTPNSVCTSTQQLSEQHAPELAQSFYKTMLDDLTAAQFLSNDQVQERLSGSMQQWIITLFSLNRTDDLRPVIAQQKHIGEVHARINIPVHLVLRGARVLKDTAAKLLHNHTEEKACLAFIYALIDMAMEVMSQVYAVSNDKNSRDKESYRLFSIAQNSANEKERQRAALLDWENQTMFDIAMGLQFSQLNSLSSSEFGLWFRHKGAHAFAGSDEAPLITESFENIDTVILPMLKLAQKDPKQHQQLLRTLREQTRSIAYHLDTLFSQVNQLESGRDTLTQLLNRKFLPVVLNKEISYARKHERHFCILIIDADHFKRINDTYGHESGDVILQQLASLLSNSCRSGDYIFRFGGEEFLMLLVDMTADKAAQLANKLRLAIENEEFRLPRGVSVNMTVSIGLAQYSGHPDPQVLLNKADAALYQAKGTGRNQVIIAD
ncbi:MAG: diguanylate cyclase [Gammaproteobacteria bacterium]|nr:diguanylate cyclase [Gammaproteobacteria bacterium]